MCCWTIWGPQSDHSQPKTPRPESPAGPIPRHLWQAQCQRIRAALSQFSLTTFEAMRHLDCYDPRARVMQLRNQGERINTHWQVVLIEAGVKHRVGVYTLQTGTDAQP